MRPLRPTPAAGRDARERREAARTAIAGAAPWALLALGSDTARTPGEAVDTWHARVGTSPTSSGALRPAADGHDLLFGGAQRMSAATGLIGGQTGVTSVCMVDVQSSTGMLWAYGAQGYYDGKRAIAYRPGSGELLAGNGESVLADRANVRGPVGIGMRVLGTRHNRAAAAGAELAVYDRGAKATPTATVDNDTTGTYDAAQACTIGAYSNGTEPLTGRFRAIGLVASALTDDEIRRLSLLLEAACG